MKSVLRRLHQLAKRDHDCSRSTELVEELKGKIKRNYDRRPMTDASVAAESPYLHISNAIRTSPKPTPSARPPTPMRSQHPCRE